MGALSLIPFRAPLSTNLLCTMGLVPMTLGQKSLRHIASASDSLSVGSPVSVERCDALSDADPQGCLQGVDSIGDMSDVGNMLGPKQGVSDVSKSIGPMFCAFFQCHYMVLSIIK